MPSRRWPLYRQLPAQSPVSPAATAIACAHAAGFGVDARARLAALLQRRFQADGVLLVGSGTHALQLALAACRSRNPGAIALLPAYTCYEVATAAIGADARVALYDLDPDTLRPDADSVLAAARGRPVGALVVSPLYGMPVDWGRARDLAMELGATLVEDAAQATGSSFGGSPVGSFGDLTVLSFGRGKGWTGMGGGALLWRGSGTPLVDSFAARTEPVGRAREAMVPVHAAAQWILGRPALYGIPAALPGLQLGETIYHEPTPIKEMARAGAALALALDSAAQREAEGRRAASADYDQLQEGSGVVLGAIGARRDPGSGMLRYPIRVRGGWKALRQTEGPRLGAGPPYPMPIGDLPALADRLLEPGTYPGARRLVDELVTLPTHSRTTARGRARLIALLGADPADSSLSRHVASSQQPAG